MTVAPDATPGSYVVNVSTSSNLGSNRGWRNFDLNELRGTSRVLHIRISDSQPVHGWGAWLARARVTLSR